MLNMAPALIGSSSVSAQNYAIKTNLVWDATRTVNIGAEFKLASNWTIEVPFNINAWSKSDDLDPKWRQLTVQPEVRYFFKEAFKGHFVGFHAHGGTFNLGGIKIPINLLGSDFNKLENLENRYEGWLAGAGVNYGYVISLSNHWKLELELGVGYVYLDYDIFKYALAGKQIGSNTHHYFGPTDLGVTISYLF
ncbi:MAG: DUF3575 domain-containing protein [Bacteroidales bacterium]|nr:DUF3575 domain-containing protein [Bacteroidales bacterium]